MQCGDDEMMTGTDAGLLAEQREVYLTRGDGEEREMLVEH
jgi:hypothetical protein